jgi:hypothetical protein
MKGRAKWSNESRACVLTNDDDGRYSVTVTSATDIGQLIIMLIGLLRTGQERNGLLGHLYVQVSGVMYRVPLLTMTIYEIRLGLGVACRRDDSRDSNHGRFLFLGCHLRDKLHLTVLIRSSCFSISIVRTAILQTSDH